MIAAGSPPVLLTRTAADSAPLAGLLAEAGVPALVWPALRFEAVPLPPDVLAGVAAVGFVSREAARAVLRSGPARAHLAAGPRPPALVAQGPGTAEVLAAHGLACATASPPDAAGLAQALAAAAPPPGPVALVRGDIGRDVALLELQAAGYAVRAVTAYRNLPPRDLPRPPTPLRAVVFGSPSAVERHLAANPWLLGVPAVAIGPTTAAALARTGHRAVRVAPAPTAEALAALLLESP